MHMATLRKCSPENELLLCSARVAFDGEHRARFAQLCERPLNWEYLLRMSYRHVTWPLLYWHANRLGPNVVPAAILEQLRDQFIWNTRHNLALAGELLQVLHLFKAAGIRALAFKGPTLTAFAYGNLALRVFNDLDLLVLPADLPRARELLSARGYRVQLGLSTVQEAAYVTSIRQLPLVAAESRTFVELHTHITPKAFRFPIDPEQMWQRRQPVYLGGQQVSMPATEDLLLILCIHGAKHLWTSLGWVCDVAEVLRSCPQLNWPSLLKEAGQLRTMRMLLLGLRLAHDLLDADLPPDILNKAGSNAGVAALAANVCQRLFGDQEQLPGGIESAVFHVKARECWRDGLAYGLSVALAPTLADWKLVSLPRSLSFLYYLLRLVRLVGKLGRQVLVGRG